MSIDTNSDKWTAHVAEVLQDRRTAANDSVVEQFFAKAFPEDLWHYTSLKAFEGIIESGTLWATEARYTTDSTEFVHARDLAKNFLSQLKPNTDTERFVREHGLKLVDEEFETGSLSASKTEIFVASFSHAENLKSQWMEYADSGRGVSIAFDLRNVRPPTQAKVAVTLAPCIYGKVEAEVLLQAALDHYLGTVGELYRDTADLQWVRQKLREWQLVDKAFGRRFDRTAFDRHMNAQFEQNLRVSQTLTKFDLLRLASHCKNPFYREEQEWRLSLPHTKGTPLSHIKIQHRGPNNNIPFVAHNLFSVGKLPITKVMVGPFCTDSDAVESILKKNDYAVPILTFNTPIRRAESI